MDNFGSISSLFIEASLQEPQVPPTRAPGKRVSRPPDRMTPSTNFAAPLAIAALMSSIDSAVCEPARPISSTVTMLHGLCIDSFNSTYLNVYDANTDVFNSAGLDRSHIAGSDEPVNAHVYSIDSRDYASVPDTPRPQSLCFYANTNKKGDPLSHQSDVEISAIRSQPR